jgi:hypothetical protein
MASDVTVSLLDYGGESSRTRFQITTMTAANFDAVNLDVTDLVTAIDGISLMTISGQQVVSGSLFLSRTKPASVDAQREKKWLIRYEDNTTHKIYRNEIPGADLSLLATNSDMADLSLGAWTSFIAAFEAVVKSPDGNAVTFLDAQYVGKRL